MDDQVNMNVSTEVPEFITLVGTDDVIHLNKKLIQNIREIKSPHRIVVTFCMGFNNVNHFIAKPTEENFKALGIVSMVNLEA